MKICFLVSTNQFSMWMMYLSCSIEISWEFGDTVPSTSTLVHFDYPSHYFPHRCHIMKFTAFCAILYEHRAVRYPVGYLPIIVSCLLIDCCTVLAWWLLDSQWDMRHGLPLAGISSFVIGWSRYTHQLHWILGNYGLKQLVIISNIFQTPLTVPLHSPNGRQMPAISAVQGDCEIV